MPGFAVLVVEAGAAVFFAAEQEAGAADSEDGDDVPSVFGDDVGGDQVDLGGVVGNGASSAAAVGVDAIEAVEELGGTFNLDAPKECGGGGGRVRGAAGVEDEVVAFAVAIGLGDAEAEAGGDEDEDEFGEFSAALGGEFTAEGINGWDGSWARR